MKTTNEKVLAALKRARHNLQALSGLWATDKEPLEVSLKDFFQLNEWAATADLDEAITALENQMKAKKA